MYWSADFVNDPTDDYNIVCEVLYKNHDIAMIKKIKNELIIHWYKSNEDIEIPVEWLMGLLVEVKKRI